MPDSPDPTTHRATPANPRAAAAAEGKRAVPLLPIAATVAAALTLVLTLAALALYRAFSDPSSTVASALVAVAIAQPLSSLASLVLGAVGLLAARRAPEGAPPRPRRLYLAAIAVGALSLALSVTALVRLLRIPS